jgi:hypothetical protein
MDFIDKKVEELIEKFYIVFKESPLAKEAWRKEAIQCSIICVDEIIASYKNKSPNYENETYWHPIDYWQQVKERLLAKQ